jgi:hypothetical protein
VSFIVVVYDVKTYMLINDKFELAEETSVDRGSNGYSDTNTDKISLK